MSLLVCKIFGNTRQLIWIEVATTERKFASKTTTNPNLNTTLMKKLEFFDPRDEPSGFMSNFYRAAFELDGVR